MPWRKGSRWQSPRRAEEPYARGKASAWSQSPHFWCGLPQTRPSGLRRPGWEGNWPDSVGQTAALCLLGGDGGEWTGSSGLPCLVHCAPSPRDELRSSSHARPPARLNSVGTEGPRAPPDALGTTWGPGVGGGISDLHLSPCLEKSASPDLKAHFPMSFSHIFQPQVG